MPARKASFNGVVMDERRKLSLEVRGPTMGTVDRLLQKVSGQLAIRHITGEQAHEVASYLVGLANSGQRLPRKYSDLRRKFPFVVPFLPRDIIPRLRGVFKTGKSMSQRRWDSYEAAKDFIRQYYGAADYRHVATVQRNTVNFIQHGFLIFKGRLKDELIDAFARSFSRFLRLHPSPSKAEAENFFRGFKRKHLGERRAATRSIRAVRKETSRRRIPPPRRLAPR